MAPKENYHHPHPGAKCYQECSCSIVSSYNKGQQ